MGKRILVQRRGKGGMQYRAPSKGKIAPAKYPKMKYQENHIGKIDKIINERGRDTPLTRIKLDDGTDFYTPAVTGLELHSEISIGNESEITNGNILQLLKIPDGTQISNIEIRYGDGGKLVRSAGNSALLVGHINKQVSIKLASGELKLISELCRATVGKISGGGRIFQIQHFRVGKNGTFLWRKYEIVFGIKCSVTFDRNVGFEKFLHR